MADGKRLRQVMMNLISNAIKFTPEGTVSVDLKYRNQVAYFSVIDTGVGIEQEDISRISEAFVRIANPLHQVAGSGLGLAITQALVYRMGGDLSIDSEFGKGSTFTVSLMLPSSREVAHQPVVADRVIGYQGETLSLMVVDDDAVQRRLLIDTLTPLGFNVIAAADGASCLQMLEQCTPKLFMLDISMPNMTGWELAAELRQRGLTVPIVMISAEADEGLGPDGGHHQEQDAPLHNNYLVKPINMPTLLTTLADQLDITLQLASEAQAVSVDSAEAATSKIKSGIKNDPLIVKELLYFIDIGYLDGFKNALTKAEIAARLNPQLCADLQRNLAQLDLTKLHSQLTMINNEI
jgi:CheY-like chemotaxis protein